MFKKSIAFKKSPGAYCTRILTSTYCQPCLRGLLKLKDFGSTADDLENYIEWSCFYPGGGGTPGNS